MRGNLMAQEILTRISQQPRDKILNQIEQQLEQTKFYSWRMLVRHKILKRTNRKFCEKTRDSNLKVRIYQVFDGETLMSVHKILITRFLRLTFDHLDLKTGRFEKLLGFARSHFIVTCGSVSLSCATKPYPSRFYKS